MSGFLAFMLFIAFAVAISLTVVSFFNHKIYKPVQVSEGRYSIREYCGWGLIPLNKYYLNGMEKETSKENDVINTLSTSSPIILEKSLKQLKPTKVKAKVVDIKVLKTEKLLDE